MRRLAARLGVCALLGVASTAATSWVLALAPAEYLTGATARADYVATPIAPPVECRLMLVKTYSGWGWLWVTSIAFYSRPTTEPVWDPYPVVGSGSGSGQREYNLWRELHADLVRRHERPPRYCARMASGWPSLAMMFEISQQRVPGRPTLRHGIALVDAPHYGLYRRDVSRQALPLRPLWRGFLANSALFAVAWSLPLRLPRLVRGFIRRWRGLCPRCGYRLTGTPLPGCPECGWRRDARP
ncbi:MAG: hypothetical protein ACYTE6_02825 [Planctomycetota bacterium]